jgi:hypothetical protein
MSILKVNTIQDKGGNAIISSDGSGNLTQSFASNTPAFKASKNNAQSVSNNTYTVVQYDDEDYDSDGCYDTSTYKFTPTSSGQYFFYAQIFMDWTSSQFLSWKFRITKNGSAIAEVELNSTDEYGQATISGLSDANGTTDYFQVEALINGGSGVQLYSNAGYKAFFLGYKLIGA